MAVLDRVAIDLARLDPEIDPPPYWWLDVPAIASVQADGLALDPNVTVIVGENGSGKSTFVEALACRWAAGLSASVKHWSPEPAGEDANLWKALVVSGELPRPQGGCFLRAEAMHGLFDAIDRGVGPHEGAVRAFGGRLNTRSHGESFLAFLESRLDERGLVLLDEPEAALSFTSSLRLLSVIDALVSCGSQVVMATHSPVLAAYPGATVLEFGSRGIARVEWEQLELVQHWQAFLDRPDLYLGPLLE